MWTPPKYDLRREQGKLVVRYAVTLAALLVVALVTVGCDIKPMPKYAVNQEKRHRYFTQCMNILPAGPQQTHYNDWDEVVEACSSAAYYQALQCVANCEDSHFQ